jgi:formylglycine-generating enzyme required for sulfatase activity
MTRLHFISWLLAALILIPIQVSAASRGLELELKSSDKPNAPLAGSVQLYQASYALVIGIDRYTNGWPALRNAVNDARAVATKLEGHGFDVTLRENLKADDFRRTLREFFARTGRDPEARLLLWYAGHGHTVDGEGFLVPADAPRGNDPDFLVDALPLRDFGSLVRLAKSKHVLSIFDACFAGTVFEARGGVPTAAITSKTTKPVRQFITSGDAGQQVRDDGSFREYFLRALSGDEKADFNDDGYVTGEELGLFLSQRMTALTQASQTPKSGKLHDVRFNQGDFVFALERPVDVAAPASGGGFSLGDLKKQQKQDQVEQAWAAKLTEMKAAYAQTSEFEAGGGSVELKVQAWQRFATAFAQNNPFVVEDDQLRRLGASRVEHWMGRRQVTAVVTVPKTETPTPIKPVVGMYPQLYKPGDTFKDCGDCPEMVVIPAGSFRMGDLNEGGASNEKPIHLVTIPKAFAVGKFEVTQAQWKTVMGSKLGYFKDRNKPVGRVSWDGAQVYIVKLNNRLGLSDRRGKYRLMSEAEWEYVARARTTTKYHFGNSISKSQANNGGKSTVDVGRYPANEFGLHDVHGNVWEWTEDCWSKNYSGAPNNGSAWTSGNCGVRVLRGGSWNDDPGNVRSAVRIRGYTDDQYGNYGFRVARTLSR